MDNPAIPAGLRCVTIIATHQCNARCLACGYWRHKDDLELKRKLFERLVPWLRTHGVRRICWSGGEPTLHTEFEELLALTARAGISSTLLTNGSTFGSIYKRIYGLVDHIVVSIDAPDENLFYKIRGLRGYQNLLRIPAEVHRLAPKTTITFSFLLQHLNLDCVVECAEIAGRSGSDRIAFLAPDYWAIGRPSGRGESFGWKHSSAAAASLVRPTRGQVARFMQRIPLIHSEIARHRSLALANHSLERLGEYLSHFACGRLRGNAPIECGVAADHVVVTAGGKLRACWLTPELFPIEEGKDPFNQTAILEYREQLVHNTRFRKEKCKGCMQGTY